MIHFNFMEAFINLKQYSYAIIHYEFFTKKLFNNLGLLPSEKLTSLYKRIKSQEANPVSNIDLSKIDNEMIREFDFGGVLFCEIKYFKFLYNFVQL